jgi:hypothetical protein
MFRNFPKFVVRLAVLAVATHVCFSGIMALVVEQAFPHRMLNVRAIEPDDRPARMELIASFLDAARRDGRPLIGFFGSSFTNGYPFPPSATLSNGTAEAFPDHRVVNVSVLGAGLEGIHSSLQLAAIQECRFETLVLEIPVINESSWIQQNPQNWRRDYAEARDGLGFARGSTHFKWFFRRPAGIRYLAIMFEELTLADEEMPCMLVPPTDGYFATREKFEAVRKDYHEKVRWTVRAAQEISDRVVVYPTPVFLAGTDRIRYDTAAIREQIDITYAACRSVEGATVVQLDERFLQDERLYFNLTHLGLQGNREFGAWLAGEIGRPADHRDAVADKSSPESALR